MESKGQSGNNIGRRIRVAIQQPALPAYRVPFFEGLNRRTEIEPKFYVSPAFGVPPSAFPRNLRIKWGRTRSLFGKRLFFDVNQVRSAAASTDVNILSWNVRYLSLPVAIVVARLRRHRVLLWGHGYSAAGGRLGAALRGLTGSAAHGVIVYDSATANMCKGEYRSVYVAPNALDSEPIRWIRDKGNQIPEKQDGNACPVVLCMGRLEERRNIQLLVHAFQELLKEVPRARLVIIGDGPIRRELTRMVDKMGLARQVHFAGPLYDEHRIAYWALQATVACLPGVVGLAALHYAAYGLPIVLPASSFRKHAEARFFVPGQSALSFADEDAHDLAQKLLQVISDETLARKLREGADEVSQHASMSNMIDGMVAAILDDAVDLHVDWREVGA